MGLIILGRSAIHLAPMAKTTPSLSPSTCLLLISHDSYTAIRKGQGFTHVEANLTRSSMLLQSEAPRYVI
jgi:hypothetical protein